MAPDYSLYLITDSRDSVLRGKDFFQVVEAAIEGGQASGPSPRSALGGRCRIFIG